MNSILPRVGVIVLTRGVGVVEGLASQSCPIFRILTLKASTASDTFQRLALHRPLILHDNLAESTELGLVAMLLTERCQLP